MDGNKCLYDQRCKKLDPPQPGDLVVKKRVAWGGRNKLEDHFGHEAYVVTRVNEHGDLVEIQAKAGGDTKWLNCSRIAERIHSGTILWKDSLVSHCGSKTTIGNSKIPPSRPIHPTTTS
jgi:hypothetical protein